MARASILTLAGLSLLALACSGPSATPDASADAGQSDAPDAGSPDAGRIVDAGPNPVFDTSTTWMAAPLDCPDGPAQRVGRDLGDQRRFALSVLHYNIQYVAGGLDNFYIGGFEPSPGWTDDRVQDLIVTVGLVPVLDMLDSHPGWTLTIEMQAYMIEILLARHRDVAQHLVDLVRGGQIELLSFHYADQLFLAYPRHHMELSQGLVHDTLAGACLAPSSPVFTQEGQYGEGMADLLGSDSVLLLPKNLFSYFHGDVSALPPYYQVRDVPVVIAGRGVDDAASGFQTQWVYMDDAELLATDGIDPYFPLDFMVKPEAIAAFESRLSDLEANGYVIAGVSDYVATLQSAGVTPEDLPPTIDGTWQPDDTDDLGRWMGDSGAFADGERDNGVLTKNTRAGRMALAAETALAAAQAAGSEPPGAADDLRRAWRDLLLGEVSDATGWNPIPNEVAYAMIQAGLASDRARSVAIAAAAALGVSPPFVVDTRDGSVHPASELPPPSLEDDPAPPFTLTGGDRPFTSQWQRVSGEPDHHVLTVAIAAGDGPAEITLPWPTDTIRYTPALLDGTSVDVPLSALTFTTAGVPIDAGPFALDDDQWLVLDTASVALAARLDRAAQTVSFVDHTLPATGTATWIFHVVTGPVNRALAVADALNVHPRVRVDAP